MWWGLARGLQRGCRVGDPARAAGRRLLSTLVCGNAPLRLMTLPEPSDAFQWVNRIQGPMLVCLALEGIAPHLMTTRMWRLGARSADNSADAWDEVAKAIEVGA